MNRRDATLFILLIWAVTIATALVTRPLLAVDETRYLTVAWEMWSGGNWLVPHLNGLPYSDKPPLLFWLFNLAWGLFGVSETTARLIPALFGLASVGLTALLARLLWPDRPAVAAYAAVITLCTGLFMVISSLVRFDAALAAFTLAALVGALLALRRGEHRWWLLYALSLAAGILTKGPVAALHLLAPLLLAPLWLKAAPGARPGRWYGGLLGGTALGMALALAWALAAAAAGQQAYAEAIGWGQTAGRVVHAFAHANPWWFYIPLLPALFYPWLWWPALWRAAAASPPRRWDLGQRFCVLWFASLFVAFSAISGKQPHYLLPMVPAFALFAARLLAAPEATVRRWDLLVVAAPAVLVAASIPAVAHIGPLHRALAAAVRLPAWAGQLPIASLLAAAGLSALIAWRFGAGKPAQCRGIALIVAALFVAVHVSAATTLLPHYDWRAVAEILRSNPSRPVAYSHPYHGEFGFLARLTRPVARTSLAGAGDWLAAHPGGVAVLRYKGAPPDLPGRPVLDRPYRGGRVGVWIAPQAEKAK